MSEETDDKPGRREIDWAAIERHYRAGQLSLNEIARQYGVSRPAITKKAEKEGWVRDLQEKIELATKNKVVAAVATKAVTGKLPPVTGSLSLPERQMVEASANEAATVDLQGREDVLRALSVQRGLLGELETLSNPEFAPILEAIAEAYDESGPTPNGGWKTDKTNELYRYVISLAGRIKMAKELAAAHGVYIPMQRKIYRLDEEKGKGSQYEDLLARLGSQAAASE